MDTTWDSFKVPPKLYYESIQGVKKKKETILNDYNFFNIHGK